ncbi:MAG: hypothetical protein J6X45_07240 [Lachnospiraceae bacterium]|nr:hypothetical protein [Lachnospiraceae bacterium]
MSYEMIAKNYAHLVKEGKRSLDSIKNPIVRQRVEEILAEWEKEQA